MKQQPSAQDGRSVEDDTDPNLGTHFLELYESELLRGVCMLPTLWLKKHPEAPASILGGLTTVFKLYAVLAPTTSSVPDVPCHKVVAVLGRGGMGVVYHGRDERLERDVAIKTIRSDKLTSAAAIERFVGEAKLTSQLQHPGVPSVHELGTLPDGRPYFSMEIIRGRTLCDILADRHGPPGDLQQLLSIFQSICQTVAYAHSQDIIHRDLKPSNVMVGEFDIVQIMDWGLAKHLSDIAEAATDRCAILNHATVTLGLTQDGSVLGTWRYMPPEQARGDAATVGKQSDVFSLGAILFEILTTHTPYPGTLAEFVMDAKEGRTSPARQRLETRGVDDELIRLCVECINPDSKGRPGDAGVLADRLTGYLSGLEKKAHEAVIRAAADAAKVQEAEKKAAAERRARVAATRLAFVASTAVMLGAALGIIVWYLATVRDKNVQLEQAIQSEIDAKKQLENARESEAAEAYISHIFAAQQAYDRGQFGTARSMLAKCHPQHRQWEWEYLANLFRTEKAVFSGPTREMWSVSVRQDGGQIATSGNGTTVSIWDVRSMTKLYELEGHQADVRAVRYRPGHDELVSADENGVVIVWDLASRRKRLSFKAAEAIIRAIAIDPSGQLLATGDGNNIVKAWSLRLGDRVWEHKTHSKPINGLCFHPKGSYLASAADDGKIVVSNPRTGSHVKTIAYDAERVYCVAFNPAGSFLASGQGSQAVCVWDTKNWELKHTFMGHRGTIRGIAYNKSGTKLATAGDDLIVRLWDIDTQQLAQSFRGHEEFIRDLAFEPDGHWLASAGHDGAVRLWACDDRQHEPVLRGHESEVNRVAISPDGKLIATSGEDRTVRLWDSMNYESRGVLAAHSKEVVGIAFSPDGATLATGSADRSIRLWNLERSEQIAKGETNGTVRGLAYSRDGKLLAIAGGRQVNSESKGELSLRHAHDLSEVWTVPCHDGAIRTVVYSPDATLIVTASADGMLKLWDATNGKEIDTLAGHKSSIWCVCFSPDGSFLASSGSDRTIRLWNVADRKQIAVWVAHQGTVHGVCFSPDGRRLASVGFDRVVRLWIPHTGRELLSLAGHDAEVYSVSFSTDGKILASCSADRTVRLWKTQR